MATFFFAAADTIHPPAPVDYYKQWVIEHDRATRTVDASYCVPSAELADGNIRKREKTFDENSLDIVPFLTQRIRNDTVLLVLHNVHPQHMNTLPPLIGPCHGEQCEHQKTDRRHNAACVSEIVFIPPSGKYKRSMFPYDIYDLGSVHEKLFKINIVGNLNVRTWNHIAQFTMLTHMTIGLVPGADHKKLTSPVVPTTGVLSFPTNWKLPPALRKIVLNLEGVARVRFPDWNSLSLALPVQPNDRHIPIHIHCGEHQNWRALVDILDHIRLSPKHCHLYIFFTKHHPYIDDAWNVEAYEDVMGLILHLSMAHTFQLWFPHKDYIYPFRQWTMHNITIDYDRKMSAAPEMVACEHAIVRNRTQAPRFPTLFTLAAETLSDRDDFDAIYNDMRKAGDRGEFSLADEVFYALRGDVCSSCRVSFVRGAGSMQFGQRRDACHKFTEQYGVSKKCPDCTDRMHFAQGNLRTARSGIMGIITPRLRNSPMFKEDVDGVLGHAMGTME